MAEKPLIQDKFQLQKYPGKSGWTYVALPGVVNNPKSPFRWLKVKGSIDHYEFKDYHLMPMGSGQLFLPVKSAVRKLLGKGEGDYVKVTIYEDLSPIAFPNELIICLKDEPLAYQQFLRLPESRQKEFIKWIEATSKEETRASRIAITIDKLLQGQTLNKKIKL